MKYKIGNRALIYEKTEDEMWRYKICAQHVDEVSVRQDSERQSGRDKMEGYRFSSM